MANGLPLTLYSQIKQALLAVGARLHTGVSRDRALICQFFPARLAGLSLSERTTMEHRRPPYLGMRRMPRNLSELQIRFLHLLVSKERASMNERPGPFTGARCISAWCA